MTNANWIEGHPKEKGYYWFYSEDQGGWPYITMHFVYRLGDAWFSTCLNEGNPSTTSQLSAQYHTYKHMKIEKPTE